MQTIVLDDIYQVRYSSKIVLVNPKARHMKLLLTSATMNKEMSINPCSFLRLHIQDGSQFRVTGDKDYVYQFAERILKQPWWADETLTKFYKFTVSCGHLQGRLEISPRTTFRTDVNAVKDMLIRQIITQIKDEQFQQQYEHLINELVVTYGFLPAKTLNELFAKDLAKLLNDTNIDAPQSFNFGRCYKTSVLRAVLAVICHSFPDFPDSQPLKPECGEQLLHLFSKRCVMEARRAIPADFEAAVRGDVDSLRKVIAEAILADFHYLWTGPQIFRLPAQLDYLAHRAAPRSFSRPLYLEDTYDVLACNQLIHRGVLPTREAVLQFYGQQDIDVAICVCLVDQLGLAPSKEAFHQRAVQIAQLNSQLLNETNDVVLGLIIRIQTATRAYCIKNKNAGALIRRQAPMIDVEEIEQQPEAEELAYFVRSYNAMGTADASGMETQQLIGSQMLLQKELKQMQRKARSVINAVKDELSEGTDQASAQFEGGISTQSTSAVNEPDEISEIINRAPHELSDQEHTESAAHEREEYSQLANAMPAESNEESTGSQVSEGFSDMQREYSEIINRLPQPSGSSASQRSENNEYSQIANKLHSSDSQETTTTKEFIALSNDNNDDGSSQYSHIINQLPAASELSDVDKVTVSSKLDNEIISEDAPDVQLPWTQKHIRAAIVIQGQLRARKIARKRSQSVASAIQTAAQLMAAYSIQPQFLQIFLQCKSPYQALFNILKAREIILKALCQKAAFANDSAMFKRREKAAKTIQRAAREQSRESKIQNYVSRAATTVQRYARGFLLRCVFKFAKTAGVLDFVVSKRIKTVTSYWVMLFTIEHAKKILHRHLKSYNTTRLQKLREDVHELMGPCSLDFFAFADSFNVKTHVSTMQFLELYYNAGMTINKHARFALARKSRKRLLENKLSAISRLDFLRPSTIVYDAMRYIKALTTIVNAARGHLRFMCESSDGQLFDLVNRYYNRLSYSRHIQIVRIFVEVARPLQKAAKSFLLRQAGNGPFSCISRRIKWENAVRMIQTATHGYFIDNRVVQLHCKALAVSQLQPVQHQKCQLVNASCTIQKYWRDFKLFSGAALWSLRLYQSNIKQCGKAHLLQLFAETSKQRVLLRFCKVVHAAGRLQSFARTSAYLRVNNGSERVRQLQMIFSRIRFAQQNPTVSLNLHATILSTTDVPERHQRSLNRLQGLQLPYHQQLMSALIKCAFCEQSRALAFSILQTYLPMNFTVHMRVESDIFKVVDAAIACKTLESARFLKNTAKMLPMCMVSKVRHIIQWRKSETDEEVRRLLKGAIHYCEN